MKKLLALVLLFAAFAALLAGCNSGSDNDSNGNNGNNADNGDKSAVSTDGGSVQDASAPDTTDYIETLGLYDFDGYTFKIIAQHYDQRPNFPSEEENGEPMNDSLLQRNRMIEEMFNIKIENIAFEDRGKVRDNVNKSVKAQDLSYDMIITAMADGINTLAPGGSLYDLNSLQYVKLDADWWCKSLYSDMQINNKLFYTSGPLSPFFYYVPVIFVYNKNLAKSYDIGDMNQLVTDNEWTADKLQELVKDKNRDLDGDGVMTKNDFYALLHDGGVSGQGLFTAFGQRMTVHDGETYFKLNFESEAAVNVINKCAEILHNPESTGNGNIIPWEMRGEFPIFRDKRSLFLITSMDNIMNELRIMEDDYGILPLPKLNSQQEEYVTFSNPWGPCGIAVPAYCDNPERTGIIMESTAYLSYERVRPAMYEIIIKNKLARDEESEKMLDIIYSNSYFDLDGIHDFGGSAILMRDAACGNIEDFVSKYEKIKAKAETAMTKLIDQYLALE